jgi:hypothetical protein
MLFENLQDCKKTLKEYRRIRNAVKAYTEYEKNQGLNETEKGILEYNLKKIESLTQRVKTFIENIEDQYVRSVFCMRYLSGYSWDKVAVFFGGVASTDSYRKTCSRFLQKYFQGNRE